MDKKRRHNERLMRWRTGGSGAMGVLGHRRRWRRGGGALRGNEVAVQREAEATQQDRT